MKSTFTRTLFLAAVCGLVGCTSGTAPAPGPSPSPSASPAFEEVDGEGCEHLAEGPAAPVTAVASPSTAAPVVSDDHKRYDVTLIDVAGKKGGVVRFNSPDAATFVVFLNKNVPLQVKDAAGKVIPLAESATSSGACAAIQGRHEVALDVGVAYLEFGPTDEASVSVVLEEAGADHAHD